MAAHYLDTSGATGYYLFCPPNATSPFAGDLTAAADNIAAAAAALQDLSANGVNVVRAQEKRRRLYLPGTRLRCKRI